MTSSWNLDTPRINADYFNYPSSSYQPFEGTPDFREYDSAWDRSAPQFNWDQIAAPERSDAPSWRDFGNAALNAFDKASTWRGLTTGSSGTSYRPSERQSISAPNAEITDLGSGYKMIRPAPKVTQKSSGGSSGGGIFSGILDIAAPIASVIPGGQGAAAVLTGVSRGAKMLGAQSLTENSASKIVSKKN